MSYLEHVDELKREAARFASLVDTLAFDRPVPTCPEWTVEKLVAHVGRVHRWSGYVVTHRCTARPVADEMNLSRGPVSAEWLREGAQALVATLRDTDPDTSMWVWGDDPHARWWARRQLHETLVHRLDLEIALGRSHDVDPRWAMDAVDELLANANAARAFSPGLAQLNRTGTIAFVATDDASRTSITVRSDGSLAQTDETPDVEVVGPALDVLLAATRRANGRELSLSIRWDDALAAHWFECSALE